MTTTGLNDRHYQLLKSIYYSPGEAASFSSVDRLYREANDRDPTITRSDVEKFLSGQLTYTLHRRIIRRFPRNPVVSDHHTEQAQADLIDIQKFSKSNHGFRYILTIIDVFSKMAFAAPLKNKKGETVAAALRDLFHTYRPSKLQTDEGTEFTNRHVQLLLKDNFIRFFLAKNEVIKCSIVERFQRTLMTRIQKFMTANGTHAFIDHLDDFLRAYNDSYHRTVKMSPREAAHADSGIVFRNIFGVNDRRQLLKSALRKRHKLDAGSFVRVPYRKHAFEKGYRQNFSDDIFTIEHKKHGNRRPTYAIKTYEGEKVSGSFYPEELQKVEDNDVYRVRILREKGKGRNKQVLVEYENLNEQPRWIKASELLPLK